GAALTYARRYALFTLVGIAGGGDLDAPNLCDGPLSLSASVLGTSVKRAHDQPVGSTRTPGDGPARSGLHRERSSILDPAQSAELREKLLLDIANITSADLTTGWAREALTAKNSLTAGDAKLVEDAFERRLLELPASEMATHAGPQETVT